MSTRIHELAKRFNMDGKDMLTLLKERGYVAADTKSVSSTVSKIYVEEIEKELSPKLAAAPVAPAVVAEVAEPAKARTPTGIFVKTAEDVAREKESIAAAKLAASPVAAPRPPVAAPPPPRPLPVPPPPVRSSALGTTRSTHGSSVSRTTGSSHVSSALGATGSTQGSSALGTTRSTSVSASPTRQAPSPAPAKPASSPQPVAPPPVRSSALGTTRSTHGAPPPPAPPIVTEEGGVKIIHLKPPIVVRDFATALGLKPFKLISELNQLVGFASMNSNIDEAIALKVAEKYGFMLDIKHRGDPTVQHAQRDKAKKKEQTAEDEALLLVPRPPVVCILGHVDHGKTTLLDAIRKANVAAGEAGGITQHIGAYQIEHNSRKITFLDTPGHAAFAKMRARGAAVTDIAVLVVAADDGFMPQTEEALQHAQNAEVALIVAVNKMDVKGANLDQVKAQMQQHGIPPEDWGGETITVPVSAAKGTGINELLEMILLQADVLELKANPKAEASGIIIESQVDVGRGPVATVIVERGTLRAGDALVCGTHWAKVRAMFDDQGQPLKEVTPGTPARVVGWSGTPESGAQFKAVKNAREAESLAEEEDHRLKHVAASVPQVEVSVEQLFANIAATQHRVLKVVIKTDVFGTAEAVRQILEGIKTTKVQLEIVGVDVGLVTKNDVLMASAAGAVIIGFNTKLENGVTPLAKHHGVRIETFQIIYEMGDKVREMMADMLEPESREVKLGAAEVRAIFPLAKGFVAGCLVTEGKVGRNNAARLRRGKEIAYEGKVAALKRFKDDANEVRAGLECGIKLGDYNGYQVGDLIECFEITKVRASL